MFYHELSKKKASKGLYLQRIRIRRNATDMVKVRYISFWCSLRNKHERFSAFIKEKWADGAGELGKHIRTSGGKHAPWLKV